MQNMNSKHIIEIQNNKVSISHSPKNVFSNVVAFSFQDKLLANAKEIIGKLTLNQLNELDQAGNIALSSTNKKNIIVVSLGDKKSFDLRQFFKALKSLATFISSNKNIISLDIIGEELLAKQLKLEHTHLTEQLLFNLFNNLYYFDAFKLEKKQLSLTNLHIVDKTDLTNTLNNSISMVNGIYLIKNLGNNPANIATPTYLADIATSMTKLSKKVKCDILDKKQLQALGMDCFLSVSQGSDQPPKLISLHYKGGKDQEKPIVLVGKGVTFDCGGISIKPSASMNEMKYDMMGAATVLGVFQTIVELGLPINLIAVAPCTENLIAGSATKPGDIVKTMSGKTVEILNTDAEGRLALCDALTYVEQFNPELVIDMATLTGACIIALGHAASGLYGNDDKLIAQLIASSKNTLDKVWHMPLFDDYDEGIVSSVADLANIGGWAGAGGSAVAAKFLSKFVNYKWAHLDIAGVAHIKGQYDGKNANGGATGRPFSLIVDFLRNYK